MIRRLIFASAIFHQKHPVPIWALADMPMKIRSTAQNRIALVPWSEDVDRFGDIERLCRVGALQDAPGKEVITLLVLSPLGLCDQIGRVGLA